jgi:hypothetical protein
MAMREPPGVSGGGPALNLSRGGRLLERPNGLSPRREAVNGELGPEDKANSGDAAGW